MKQLWPSTPTAKLLSVERPSDEDISDDPGRLTAVNGCREIDRKFSASARIQFTAPDKSLGSANRDLGAIDSIVPYSRISARLDVNRQVKFNAQ
jgi:hypothetical protein